MKTTLLTIFLVLCGLLPAQNYTISLLGVYHADELTPECGPVNYECLDTVAAGDTLYVHYQYQIIIQPPQNIAIKWDNVWYDYIPSDSITYYQLAVSSSNQYQWWFVVPTDLNQGQSYEFRLGSGNNTDFTYLTILGYDTATSSVGITEPLPVKRIDHQEYYDITGKLVTYSTPGMLIRMTWYTDGTCEREKIFVQ